MSGVWSGGTANRYWGRPGSRLRNVSGDAERGRRLAAALAHELFWCPTCGGTHPLEEHQACRDANPFTSALKG
ncbi:MAG TPA: hypothetical protein VGS19_28980 [Streptosporangiaceae bacterium]|nr:hypothetical protein [Streptosporangiaceae bacterium]